MKKKIKINFTDFWKGFDKEDNYFIKLLSQQYEVRLSEDPDLIICSCYGHDYLKYKCIRICFISENLRPDFSGYDYVLSFDINDDPRHYRLPLYRLYIDLWGQSMNVLKEKSRQEIREEWKAKEKFCCMLVSNGHSKKRIDFFHKLSAIRQVDSGGRYLNNIGRAVDNKLEFIRDYKFVFAFENSSHPGYVTEKIIEPCFVGSIPIYWGNKQVDRDFNPRRFINYHDFNSEEALIQRILEIDRDDELAMEIVSQPIFRDNVFPEGIRDENVLAFFQGIIENRKTTPVAVSGKKSLHFLKRKSHQLRGEVVSRLSSLLR